MAIALSSPYLFHFTGREMEGLKNILRSGFSVTYSDEVEYFSDGKNTITNRRAIPMVCFCDIPLSLIESHTNVYCSPDNQVFGIGLKKNWGARQGLNPIIYVAPESYLEFLISNLNDYLGNSAKFGLSLDVKIGNHKSELQKLGIYEDLSGLLAQNDYINEYSRIRAKYVFGKFSHERYVTRLQLFTKPTVGDYPRRGVIIKDHQYYDEREWRYIPDDLQEVVCATEPLGLPEDITDFLNTFIENGENLQDRCNTNYERFLRSIHHYDYLQFQADDIATLIVHNENSVEELKQHILDPDFSICGKMILSEADREELSKKVISWEEISQDILH